MKFKPIVIGGVVFVIAVIGGVYLVTSKDDTTGDTNSAEVQTGDQADSGNTVEACDIYTQAIAEQVPGAGSIISDATPAYDASTDDVSVTNCQYTKDDPDSLGILTASALVRAGKTQTGKDSNVFGFEGNQDRSNFADQEGITYGPTEPISGLGEAAFWDPDFEQVNVLLGDGQYWLIIQAESRAETEQLANLLVAEF